MALVLHCDNKSCIYHGGKDGLCHSECVYYHNRLCDTYSRKGSIAELMGLAFKARCRKSGGKYRADHVKRIK